MEQLRIDVEKLKIDVSRLKTEVASLKGIAGVLHCSLHCLR